jgi:hypothetical protein
MTTALAIVAFGLAKDTRCGGFLFDRIDEGVVNFS